MLSAFTSQPLTLSCVTLFPYTTLFRSSFTLNPVTPTGSSGLTVNVAPSVAAGPHSFMVTGSPLGATTTPTTVTVIITAITPASDYSTSHVASVTVDPGVATTATITATMT